MINFLCTSPKPKLKGTDAVYNEIYKLQDSFGGEVTSVYPFSKPNSNYPALLYGLHNIQEIKHLDEENNINQIFAPSLSYVPFIHGLSKPIIYNVSTGIGKEGKLLPKNFVNKVNTFVVSNKRDKEVLNSRNIKNVKIIKSAIDIEKFEKQSLEFNGTLRLLMASAPWELKQFQTKGVHLILNALQQLKNVHVTFLWRNVLSEEMVKLIKQYNVAEKVTFINETIDIRTLLNKVHGTILISNKSNVVKSYPHSLIESLVSAKPVITSKEIPMADYVAQNECGMVLKDFEASSLVQSIKSFKNNIARLTEKTIDINVHDFSTKKMIEQYKTLYKDLLSERKSKRKPVFSFPFSRSVELGESIENMRRTGQLNLFPTKHDTSNESGRASSL